MCSAGWRRRQVLGLERVRAAGNGRHDEQAYSDGGRRRSASKECTNLNVATERKKSCVMLRIIGLMLISFINHVKINFLLKNKNTSYLYFIETLVVLDSLSTGSVHECAFKCTVDSDCHSGDDVATGDRRSSD